MLTNPKHAAAPKRTRKSAKYDESGLRQRSKKSPTRAQALDAYREDNEIDFFYPSPRKARALNLDAPESSYEIDAIVRTQIGSGLLGELGGPILQSMQSRIASPSNEYQRSERGREEMIETARYLGDQPIALARYIFNEAANLALSRAQHELIKRPATMQSVKDLVENLEYLEKKLLPRIKKNTIQALSGGWACMEERESGQRIIDYRRFGRDLKNLKLAVDVLASQAASFRQTFKLASRRGGNRDPFVRTFILVVVRNLGIVTPERPMIREHVRPLADLLAAGWRDLGFPTKDHRGKSREPLGEWFEDRIRKQFKL
jgi:hypothetical protein